MIVCSFTFRVGSFQNFLYLLYNFPGLNVSCFRCSWFRCVLIKMFPGLDFSWFRFFLVEMFPVMEVF